MKKHSEDWKNWKLYIVLDKLKETICVPWGLSHSMPKDSVMNDRLFSKWKFPVNNELKRTIFKSTFK